jgi:hypothetical protein
MRYTTAEINDMTSWEIEAAVRTWLKTLNFVVKMFVGESKKPPKVSKGIKISDTKSEDNKDNALKIIGMMKGLNG